MISTNERLKGRKIWSLWLFQENINFTCASVPEKSEMFSRGSQQVGFSETKPSSFLQKELTLKVDKVQIPGIKFIRSHIMH